MQTPAVRTPACVAAKVAKKVHQLSDEGMSKLCHSDLAAPAQSYAAVGRDPPPDRLSGVPGDDEDAGQVLIARRRA